MGFGSGLHAGFCDTKYMQIVPYLGINITLGLLVKIDRPRLVTAKKSCGSDTPRR